MVTMNGSNIRIDKRGYPYFTKTKNGVYKKTFCHVFVWETLHGPKPEGYDIHHKDEDKTNYNISNLELLLKNVHKKIHAGWKYNQLGQWTHKPCGGCKLTLSMERFTNNNHIGKCDSCQKAYNKTTQETFRRKRCQQ